MRTLGDVDRGVLLVIYSGIIEIVRRCGEWQKNDNLLLSYAHAFLP